MIAALCYIVGVFAALMIGVRVGMKIGNRVDVAISYLTTQRYLERKYPNDILSQLREMGAFTECLRSITGEEIVAFIKAGGLRAPTV